MARMLIWVIRGVSPPKKIAHSSPVPSQVTSPLPTHSLNMTTPTTTLSPCFSLYSLPTSTMEKAFRKERQTVNADLYFNIPGPPCVLGDERHVGRGVIVHCCFPPNLTFGFALQLPFGCSCWCSCNSQASGLTLHPLLHSLSQDKGNLQERNEEENAQNGNLDVNAPDVNDSEGQFHKLMLQS